MVRLGYGFAMQYNHWYPNLRWFFSGRFWYFGQHAPTRGWYMHVGTISFRWRWPW